MNKIGQVRPNVYLMSLVACIIGLGCYFLMFKVFGVSVPSWVKGPGSILVITYFISLIFIHELIHMIAAYFFVPVKSVRLKIKILTWEVSSDKPFKRNNYLIYTLAPGFLLSLIAIVLFFVFSSMNVKYLSAILFLFGFAGATGDMWLAMGALKYPRDCYVLDKGAELEIFEQPE